MEIWEMDILLSALGSSLVGDTAGLGDRVAGPLGGSPLGEFGSFLRTLPALRSSLALGLMVVPSANCKVGGEGAVGAAGAGSDETFRFLTGSAAMSTRGPVAPIIWGASDGFWLGLLSTPI